MERGLSGTRDRLATIVLVTWNSAPYLPRCLSGIAKQTWPAVELITIDNASGDDSVALLEGFGGHIPTTIVRNSANEGFSRAVNQALRVARGEFVLLLNPDASIERDYVERLIEAFDAAGEEFGAATGRLMRGEGSGITPTGVVDSLGIRMTRSGRHFDIGQGRRVGEEERGLRPLESAERRAQSAEGARSEEQAASADRNNVDSDAALSNGGRRSAVGGPLFEVFGVSGAAALFRMAFIRDVTVGGEFLDEDFFAFREDADLAWRGRIFGWRALYVPDAVAAHVRTVTPDRRRDLSPAVNMHSLKNRFLLRLKNEGPYLAMRNAPFEIARDLVTIAAVLTIERTSLPALAWLWRNRSRIAARRREIQRRRRVSDRAVAGWFR